MKVKIYSRTLFIKNLIVFVLLSYLFIYFIQNFNHPKFFTDFDLLKAFTLNHPLFAALTLILIGSLFMVARWSKYIFLIYTMGIFLFSLRLYFVNNIPAILPLSLVYVMCSYYFYSLFQEELCGAIYVPNFEDVDISPVKNKKLKVLVNEKINAHISNWDEGNLFLYLDEEVKLRGKVKIAMKLAHSEFNFEGKIVTAYNKGYGVKVISSGTNDSLNWNELYKILMDRGYNLVAKEF